MAIITILVTLGPMTIISALIEFGMRIPDWIHKKREDRYFRRTRTLFGKSTY